MHSCSSFNVGSGNQNLENTSLPAKGFVFSACQSEAFQPEPGDCEPEQWLPPRRRQRRPEPGECDHHFQVAYVQRLSTRAWRMCICTVTSLPAASSGDDEGNHHDLGPRPSLRYNSGATMLSQQHEQWSCSTMLQQWYLNNVISDTPVSDPPGPRYHLSRGDGAPEEDFLWRNPGHHHGVACRAYPRGRFASRGPFRS